ncbi:MAG TPA: T9SS type A sorting domain-containing protein, partial [Bacteroidia bacterium]|nr:T9SS type A sorting domain-containing protein [Bacteroidia bacterium]
SSSSGVSDRNSRTTFTYSNVNGLAIDYIPIEDYTNITCQGGSVFSYPLISGACGPISINWSPSIGLSSDSILNPIITFHDSIQYTITITDSTGQSASTTFIVEPDVKLNITFDTTLCNGCPVMLMATPGYSNYEWFRNDTSISIGNPNFIAIESGTYRVESYYACSMVSDNVQLTLTGLTRIRGHIYLDMDSDCVFNNADRNLGMYGQSPFLIKLERQSYNITLNTDSAGNYDIPVDTGNYRISIINPSNIFEYSCPDSGVIHVYVSTYGDTVTGNDLGFKIKYNCNRLRVNVSSSRLRPCDPASINVSYYNEGSVDENNPIVNLRLPPELINITSAQSFTTLPDNTYQFSLPPISICGIESFSVSAEVICDPNALQNATLCMDADISPVNFCSLEPSSSWDGSYVRVVSACENDSACFNIYNIADAGSDMDLPSEWRLYANNLLIQQGAFQLLSGGDTTLCFSSDGRTYRLEVDQTDSFPTAGTPDANVERCGVLQSGTNYSLNYILQSPRDNSVPFHKTYCARIFNSYDPNAKSVTPMGFGTNHIVDPNERITYRIDFQNTGNDTAYFVKIIDNLDYYFDPTTIQLISSSHPYNFSIQDNELTWLFDPIFLPDSNVDETNSHGYVEFSLKVKSITPQGTSINNTAQIYFDNNNPINANAAWIRICTPETPAINIFPVSDFCSGRISFTSTMQNQGTNPIVTWYLNGSWIATSSDTVDFNGVFFNDVISATLNSNSACSISDSVASNQFQITGTPPSITYAWPQLTSSPAVSYLWFLNNQVIPGATSQSYIPVATGDYKVRITDSTGCIFTSFAFPFVYTGLSDNNSEFLKVYPNPSTGKFKVETSEGNKSIVVLDYTGRSLLQFNTKEKSFTIDISDKFSSGIYFLTVRLGENIYYERIVVQQ